jgi:transcriptional regulator with XRE-family HTH domain
MIAEVRARRLAEVRKRQNATQVEVAAAMGVSQARVSRADFGDESYILG